MVEQFIAVGDPRAAGGEHLGVQHRHGHRRRSRHPRVAGGERASPGSPGSSRAHPGMSRRPASSARISVCGGGGLRACERDRFRPGGVHGAAAAWRSTIRPASATHWRRRPGSCPLLKPRPHQRGAGVVRSPPLRFLLFPHWRASPARFLRLRLRAALAWLTPARYRCRRPAGPAHPDQLAARLSPAAGLRSGHDPGPDAGHLGLQADPRRLHRHARQRLRRPAGRPPCASSQACPCAPAWPPSAASAAPAKSAGTPAPASRDRRIGPPPAAPARPAGPPRSRPRPAPATAAPAMIAAASTPAGLAQFASSGAFAPI